MDRREERLREITRIEPDDPPHVQEAKRKLAAELSEARVSDEGLKAMIPLFVRGKSADADHKCGGCKFRFGASGCALVFGTVSFTNGVCGSWGEGKDPAAIEHDAKMTKAEAGYIEVANGVRVVCSSCARYYRGESFCRLWMGDVEPEDCCFQYKPASRVMAETPKKG